MEFVSVNQLLNQPVCMHVCLSVCRLCVYVIMKLYSFQTHQHISFLITTNLKPHLPTSSPNPPSNNSSLPTPTSPTTTLPYNNTSCPFNLNYTNTPQPTKKPTPPPQPNPDHHISLQNKITQPYFPTLSPAPPFSILQHKNSPTTTPLHPILLSLPNTNLSLYHSSPQHIPARLYLGLQARNTDEIF